MAKLLAQFERLRARPVDNAYTLDELLAKIKKIGATYHLEEIEPKLRSWIDTSMSEISSSKERFKHEFGRNLQELLINKGFELGGRYPDLKVKFYTIHIDFPNGIASLLFGHEPIKSRIPLSPESITSALEPVHRNLNRAFNPLKFIELLYEAYRRVCLIQELLPGEKVPIIDVLQQLVILVQSPQFKADPTKDHYRGYGRAHFGYDLYRLRLSKARTNENHALGLITATFDATRNRENFIWVPDNERGDGTTYAMIFFKKVDSIHP
ncbi:MAG: hypothetical protein JSV84_01465 [Gemmatimonadota bacterium]|nr:MAG: hypothetical protein JSV84_01465 [Gemmatimonadota bacterium]